MGRVVEAGEPLWTSQDRAIAQAWFEFLERETCPKCGNPKAICHDLDLDGHLYGVVQTCHVAAAHERARQREWERFKGQASEDVEVATAGSYVDVRDRRSDDVGGA